MAAKTKSNETNGSKDPFALLDKLNKDAVVLKDDVLSTVTDWIDTGCYSLNAISSGSLFKGIPKGRITGFSGPSKSGKTYIINKIIAQFLKEDKNHKAVIFDSEAAQDAESVEKLGADSSRIKLLPIESVTDCKIQLNRFLDAIIDSGDDIGNYIVSIDSLGNLASSKELDDIAAGKSTSDMGLRAKELKSLFRTCTYRAAKSDTTILFANHTYDDPGALHPSLIQNQSGGSGALYMASILFQLAIEKMEKDGKVEEDGDSTVIPIARKVTGGQINGVTLRALSVKNRFVPALLEAKLQLNFTSGLNRYSGLLEMAKKFGVLEGTSSYTLNGEKIGQFKKWGKNPQVWAKIIKALDVEVRETVAYHNTDESDEMTEIVELDDE